MTGIAVLHLARGREWRGGERQVCLLAGTQLRAGEVRPLVATRAGSPLAKACHARSIPCSELPWDLPFDPRALLGASGALRRLAGDASGPLLIHAHDSHALQAGLILASVHGVRLVATRRSDTAPGMLWRRPRRVIALSRSVAARLEASGVERRRIVQVPSAIDRAAVSAIATGRAPDGPPVVVAAGALTAEKGHRVLIEAFAIVARRHETARLVIAGGGPERAVLEALVHGSGLVGRVELVGELDDAATVIARATVLVQPSLREALGTAILEAMALGIPVIASNTGGPSELLDDDHGVLVSPGSAASLAEAIVALLASPAERDRLARRGRDRAREFDVMRVATAVTGVYRSALTEP